MPSVRSSNVGAVLAIVGLAGLAALLAARGTPRATLTVGMMFIVIEAVASIVALSILQKMELQQARTINAALNRGVFASRLFDAAIDAIEAAYTTAANTLAGLGLIGSATFLLLGSRQSSAEVVNLDALLLIAPKAFAATGFALCCSIVVAVRGQWPFLPSLRALRDETVARYGRLAMASEAPGSTAAEAVRNDLITDVLVQFTAAFQELNARTGGLSAKLDRMLDELTRMHSSDRRITEQIISAIFPATRSLEELTTRWRSEVSDSIVEIGVVLPRIRDVVDENRAATARLVQVLTSEREGLLERHAEVLREQTVALAREALGQLAVASTGVLQTRVEEISKRIEQHAEDVYQRAYDQATQQLGRTLEQTSSGTRALADSLAEASAKLLTVQQEISGIVAALDAGTERTAESAARFRQVAEDIKNTLDAFASASPRSAEGRTLIGEIEGMTRDLHALAAFVGERLREVDGERQKMAGFRTQLLEIARKRSQDSTDG